MVHYTDALSDTESEKEQYPETQVEEVSLEKPKRKYTKRVKPDTPDTPANTPTDTPEPKPKRVLSDEHKEKMRLAREASKLRRAEAKEDKPVEDKPEDKPEEAKGTPKKDDDNLFDDDEDLFK